MNVHKEGFQNKGSITVDNDEVTVKKKKMYKNEENKSLPVEEKHLYEQHSSTLGTNETNYSCFVS